MTDIPRLLQKSFEWHTPPKIISAARKVLGTIDLDPASNKTANAVVQATNYYDIAHDGLKQTWSGNVWLNPPYCKVGGVSNQEIWTCKLIAEYEACHVQQAILLVNAATETQWFQRLYSYLICFVKGRIHFNSPTGITTGPTVGSAIVYLGLNEARFIEIFSQFGVIVEHVSPIQQKYATLNLWTQQREHGSASLDYKNNDQSSSIWTEAYGSEAM